MAQGAMSPAKTPTMTLAMTLAELRAHARANRRVSRSVDALPQLARLLLSCRVIQVEERSSGIAFRLAGETEQHAAFNLTCILGAVHEAGKLTSAERAVADLLCEGLTLARIAQLRGVSANTVKSQVRQVFRKLDVDSRVALARRWCP